MHQARPAIPAIVTAWLLLSVARPCEAQLPKATDNSYERVSAPANGDAVAAPDFNQQIASADVLYDIAQFERLLHEEWILSNLADADFDSAFRDLRRRSADGMTYSELVLEFQKVLALGKDGHAEMNWLLPVLRSAGEPFPNFIIDICGDDYIAYKVEHLAAGPVNPRYKYRFEMLRDGYPYLVAIDGVPIEKWVQAASRYVPRGPELSVRWRALQKIHYLPFWRNELNLVQSETIRVRLASRDKKTHVELDAPLGKYALPHYRIPKPDSKIADGKFGYMWVRNAASGGGQVIMESMPEFKETRGLIVDLRGNQGGASIGNLLLLSAFLLPPESPHRVVGSMAQWTGGKWDLMIAPDDPGLSAAGRKAMIDFRKRFPPKWVSPTARRVEWRYMLLTRPEAEPRIRPYNEPDFPSSLFPVYHYNRPVVVLYDQRCFSSGELFLAGVRHLDNVTLIGTETTSAAGTSAALFKLPRTGIEVGIGHGPTFVLTSGVPLEETGVRPDIICPPNIGYYFGQNDRMLSKAIELLRKSNAEQLRRITATSDIGSSNPCSVISVDLLLCG